MQLVKYHTDFRPLQIQNIFDKKAGSASGKHPYLGAQVPLKSTCFNFSSYSCYLMSGAKEEQKVQCGGDTFQQSVPLNQESRHVRNEIFF